MPAVILHALFNTIVGIGVIPCAIFFHTLFGVIAYLASLVYRCSTTLYYEAGFFLIKVVGRSPTSDSNIAWRIEGPGISKNFSQKLNPDDIYILFLS